MKKYVNPTLDILSLSSADVITFSVGLKTGASDKGSSVSMEDGFELI